MKKISKIFGLIILCGVLSGCSTVSNPSGGSFEPNGELYLPPVEYD